MISFVPRLCEPGEYEEMWSYYNDNGYYGNKQSGVSELDRIHYTGSYHISDCRFTSIDITALTEFNSDHPANSKLNDICWYSFPVSRVGGMNSGRIEESVPTPVDCSIRIGRLDNIAPDDMSLFNAQNSNYIPLLIYLDELPDAASCTIHIEIRDSSGHTFTCEGPIRK